MWHCKECNSIDVEGQVWAKANDTNQVTTADFDTNSGDCYCVDCEDNVCLIWKD